MKVYYDKDADLSLIKGKNVTIIGYGSQGHAHAQNLNDSGVKVTVGLRKGGASWSKAEKAGLKVAEIADAVKIADVVMILLPDEQIATVYNAEVAPNIKPGASLAFAHGFNLSAGCDINLIQQCSALVEFAGGRKRLGVANRAFNFLAGCGALGALILLRADAFLRLQQGLHAFHSTIEITLLFPTLDLFRRGKAHAFEHQFRSLIQKTRRFEVISSLERLLGLLPQFTRLVAQCERLRNGTGLYLFGRR